MFIQYLESKIEQNNDDLQQELQREKEEKRCAIESAERQKHKLESKIVVSDVAKPKI